jgi:methyl-accepting chemotaxis protein
MQTVQNLAQITRQGVVLAERLGIGVRLGASGIVLALCLSMGQSEPSVIAASVFFGLGIYSLITGVLLTQKRDPSHLYAPSLVLDLAAVAANGLSVVRSFGFVPALPMLVVLEAFCAAVAVLSALRLSLRDAILSGGVAVIGPAIVAFGSFFLQANSGARALFLVPVLNALIAVLAGVAATQSRGALKDNLVTEDLLRASRRLKMTMDIVAASIFNLNQLVNKLGNISTTVSSGARNQAAGIDRVTTAAANLQEAMESISQATEKSAVSVGKTAQFSESGNTIMQKIITEVLGIHDVVQRMVSALARINDIADQTNLLALNAAIEASRSGDERSGFTVVADEIVQLAEKSAVAASEVGTWGKQIESVIKAGGESSREAGRIFDTIARDLGSYAGFIHELSSSVKEQLGANREVKSAIENIGSVVDDNRDMAESVSRIVGDLRGEMSRLESLVDDKVQEVEKLYRGAQGSREPLPLTKPR